MSCLVKAMRNAKKNADLLDIPQLFRLYRQAFLRKISKVSSGGHLFLILVYVGCSITILMKIDVFHIPIWLNVVVGEYLPFTTFQ